MFRVIAYVIYKNKVQSHLALGSITASHMSVGPLNANVDLRFQLDPQSLVLYIGRCLILHYLRHRSVPVKWHLIQSQKFSRV